MSRLPESLAVMSVVALAAPAGALAAAPREGTYEGSTSQKQPITLTVKRGKLTTLQFRYRVTERSFDCLVPYKVGTWRGKAGAHGAKLTQKGTSFTWGGYDQVRGSAIAYARRYRYVLNEGVSVAGRFTRSLATGTLTWEGGIPHPGGEACLTGTVTWSARRVG